MSVFDFMARLPLPVGSIRPVARVSTLMRDGQNPELIRLHFVDEVKGKTAQAEASSVTAECPACEGVGGQEPLHVRHFVKKLATETRGLLVVEESRGAEFLIG